MAEHRRPLKRSRELDLAVVRDTLTDAVNRGDAALRAALEEKLCLVQGSGAALAARLSDPAVITELVRVLETPTAGDQKLHERLQLTIHAPGSRSSSVASRSSKARNVRPGCVQCDECLTILRGVSFFKCVICTDYTLCLECDRNKCGHAHPMLYITLETKVPNFIRATLPPAQLQPVTAAGHLVFHENTMCDSCQQGPIQGPRFRCCLCDSFELCQRCILLPQPRHDRTHVFLKILHPAMAPEELAIDIDE